MSPTRSAALPTFARKLRIAAPTSRDGAAIWETVEVTNVESYHQIIVQITTDTSEISWKTKRREGRA
ncbi:hypothetical protein BSZ39_09575 [Bowdeniella nasicola]|uniref:Uncharacterized protein n=1 Tax=Bowdeniella nasicola TaxID=208480 RepID=A0A1Q5Q147_9ACTO|nr:hypothetical protein [Bowdeniella nasicola]OKL53422.1 hypothetical protein BSZ39_09575 [Bowdeniella nasicola]